MVKGMRHEHGSEYQLKTVLEDGNEEFTGWLTQEQLVPAMASARAKGKAFWLRERSMVCLICPDREPKVQEYPVAHSDSSRYRPRDSKYLVATGVRNRAEVFRPR